MQGLRPRPAVCSARPGIAGWALQQWQQPRCKSNDMNLCLHVCCPAGRTCPQCPRTCAPRDGAMWVAGWLCAAADSAAWLPCGTRADRLPLASCLGRLQPESQTNSTNQLNQPAQSTTHPLSFTVIPRAQAKAFAATMLRKNPNTYFYRHVAPHEQQVSRSVLSSSSPFARPHSPLVLTPWCLSAAVVVQTAVLL